METEPAHKADVLSGNHWTENHPQSHFRLGIGVGLFTPKGRTSFYGGVLTRRGKDTDTQMISGLATVLDMLTSEFGLDLQLTPVEQARLSQFAS